jgi:hypothetical protein
MWIPDAALVTIGKRLDLKGLVRLCASSKECSRILKTELCKQLRTYAPIHMARLFIEARKNLPCGPFQMEVKDEMQLKFTEENQSDDEERGTAILFTAEVKEGKLEILASYALTSGICYESIGHIRAKITPSSETPMLAGSVELITDLGRNSTEHIDYTDGLDSARVVQWFPLDFMV